MTLAEQGAQVERKRAELQNIFEKAKTSEIDPATGQPLYDMDTDMVKEVNERNAELNMLTEQYEQARLADIAQKNMQMRGEMNQIDRRFQTGGFGKGRSGGMNKEGAYKLSDVVMESREFKHRNNRGFFGVDVPDVDLKTLLETTAGFAPDSVRQNRVVLSAQRRPVISDLIPTDTTEATNISWMEETTFTNNASTVSEGAEKPESALAFTERESSIKKIATWLPVTEEQLADVAQMRNILDNRLTLMLLLKEEEQLLIGQGTGADLQGFLTKSGTQAQARGSDLNEDAVYKAFKKVRWTGFAEPSGIVMHPDNWETIRLRKTTDGLYIFGDPSIEVEARLWGKPVIITSAIPVNKALTGDFQLYSHISRKLGIRVDVSDSHSDYFIKNKVAVRAEMRENLEIYRAGAFAVVSGLN